MNHPGMAGLGLSACSLLVSCALLSKAEPLVPRYFTPESDSTAATARATPQSSASVAPRLRLAAVWASSQLRERIMFRDSAHELGYYEDRRWTERPEAYLRRALARTLFEERGLVRVATGSAPTLDTELVAFEEIRAPEHKTRIQVIVTLDDDRSGSEQATITIEEPVRSDDADAAIDAFARALQRCVTQIADRVMARLIAN